MKIGYNACLRGTGRSRLTGCLVSAARAVENMAMIKKGNKK